MKAQRVYENVENILRPKEGAAELKQYFLDVLQEMLNVGYPEMEISKIQDAFNAHQHKYIEHAFNKGFIARKAAYKILDNILDGTKNFTY